MVEKWKRPENVSYPKVWSRFNGKKEINGIIPKFWVQDMIEDYFKPCFELMKEHFLRDELMSKYSNAAEDPETLKESQSMWEECVKSHVALICFMENPDSKGDPIIVGLNMTSITHKDVQKVQCKSEPSRKVFGAANYVREMKDAFETFQVNEYLSAKGLLVLPDFRGQNIGYELIKARDGMCKTLGLRLTVTVFTSILSQKIAEKCGFKVLAEITYEELAKKEPFLSFPGISEHTKILKNMYKLYEL